MARWLFTLLLRAYPHPLRDNRGREMWVTFEAHIDEARRDGARAVVAVWLREVVAAFRTLRQRAAAGMKGMTNLSLCGVTGNDLVHTVRSLLKSPGFSFIVVATLAIGVGANTAVFSVVNGVLLKPLPYPQGDRLVKLIGRFLPESGFDFREFALSEPEVLDIREQSEALVDVAAYTSDFGLTLTGGGEAPERALGVSVSAELFRTLRTEAVLGRTFHPSEDAPSGPDVVVIGSGLWERRYGGDPAIVGRTITVNGRSQEIIGVMPSGIFFPSPETEIFFPLGIDPQRDRSVRGGHYLYGVARLAPGLSLDEARAELSVIMERWKQEYPGAHSGHFLFLRPLLDDIVGGVRTALTVLMAAVGGLLLVACANVANLFLARGEERRRELALRKALGAGRLRVLRQLLTESFVLCVAGGVFGVGLASIGIRALLAINPEVIPPGRTIVLDAAVLAGSLSLVIVTSLFFTVVPAIASRDSSLQSVLQDATRGASSSRAGARFRRTLVVAEVASSLVLLVSASLLVKSLGNLLSEDPGFRTGQILTANLALPRARYEDPRAAISFYRELLDEARSLPGVERVSSVSDLPLTGSAPNNDIRIEGRPEPTPGQLKPAGSMLVASAGYFELLEVPLRSGRFFDPADREGSLPVAVVSQTMADAFWPDEDPLGQRFNPLFGEEPLLTVVGVVGDVKYQNLEDTPRAAWYFPLAQSGPIADWAARFQRIVLRVDGDPRSVIGSLRALVRGKDPELVLSDIRTMEDIAERSVSSSRFTATLLSVFAGLAVTLGASGVFAMMVISVVRRRKELGIRAALGATRASLVVVVAREGLVLCALGIALGVAQSIAATRGLESLLHDVSPTDPATFVAVASGLATVAFAASYFPAHQAARLDPVETLRAE